MNENYETMTTSEEQIVLDDGAEEVELSITETTTIERSVTLSADVKDKIGRLQVGHMTTNGNDESALYVTVKLPAVMKNAMISKAVLKLYQSFSQFAEAGWPMDLYQVASFSPEDLIIDEKEPITTIVTNADGGCYRNLDITKAIEQAIGDTVYLVLKLRGEWNVTCTCDGCCECGCNCNCTTCSAVNATFFTESKLLLTCAGEPIADGVYQMQSYHNGRYLTMGQNWINQGDLAVQKYGQTDNTNVLLGQMWRIRLLSDGLYAINSVMVPTMGLAAGKIGDINRIIAKEIGNCTAEVPEDARWMIVPHKNLWIMYNISSKLVISTPCADLTEYAPLDAVTYVDENCVTATHWMIQPIEEPPTETVLHNDLIGWVRDTSVTVALPIGATTQFHAACYAESCNCCSGWRSSNSAVASIDSTGKVTALSAGDTTISVTMGGNYVECPVTVVEGDIAIIKYSDHAQVNGTIQLQAVTVAGNETITWSSADKEKATVDANGLVTVKMVGVVEITASSEGLASKTVTLYSVIPDGVYQIKNNENGKCVAIKENELVKNATVSANASASVAEQKWHIHYKVNGKYIIRSYANPKMVFGYNDEYPDNTYVFSYVTTATLNTPQHNWTITQIDGAYVLKNCSTNKVLTVSDGNAYTSDFASGNNKQHWLLNSTNGTEEIVLYDETNSKYLVRDTDSTTDENNVTTTTVLDRSTVYLEPNVVHQYRAILRAPMVKAQTFTWEPVKDDEDEEDAEDVVTIYGNGCVQTCEELAEGAKSTSVTIKTAGSDLTYELVVGVRIPVKSVDLSCCMKMLIGRKIRIAPMLSPFNATPYSIKWNSSPKGIVEIDDEGNVTALSGGEATITVTVNDGTNHVAKGSIFVETRERVKIEKDGSDQFIVKFVDEILEAGEEMKVWHSIMYDFDNDNNEEPYYTTACDRYRLNENVNYTQKQLAFLYLIDPLGVIHFVKHSSVCKGDSLTDHLKYKDSLYYEIFGTQPSKFYVDSLGNKTNKVTGWARSEFYTDAELVFGTHVIGKEDPLAFFVVDFTLGLLDILDIFEDDPIMKSMFEADASRVEAAKLSLYTASITDYLQSKVEDKISSILKNCIEKGIKKGAAQMFKWATFLLDTLNSFLGALEDSFYIIDTTEMQIYDKVKRQTNYRTIFVGNSSEMFMDEILDLCSPVEK